MDDKDYVKSLKSLGDNLKKIRVLKKMTQSEVAKQADIHVNYYARIERAEENPSFAVLYAIAKAFKVKLSQIAP